MEFAVTQLGHAPTFARDRLAGASAVRDGNRFILRDPTCNRLCICLAATSGARDDICDIDLLECVGWKDRALAVDLNMGGLNSVELAGAGNALHVVEACARNDWVDLSCAWHLLAFPSTLHI